MGNIRQTWLLKDSKTWSKKDASYLVDSILNNKLPDREIREVLRDNSGIYNADILGLPSDSKRLASRKTSFAQVNHYHVHKLGWTFFQKDRDGFHCRESLTYNLQRSIVQNGKNLDANKMCIVGHSFGAGKKNSFLEEHWSKFIDAFLGMCGVSKNIRRNFTGYSNKSGYAIFPASLALWRSTLFTAPSVLVGLMRYQSLFIKSGTESLNTIPEIIELLLDDKKMSWETNGKRMYRYNNFGVNSMLWFTLLWIDKIRAVCDDFNFIIDKHYSDGPNNFVFCTKKSIAKILSSLDMEERKEVYLLLGGNDKETYNKLVSNLNGEIRDVLCGESFGG